MAHRILGLDIGSRAIKLAIVDKTLRQTALVGWDQEPVPAGADAATRLEAIRRLLARTLRADDVVAVGMPTSQCMHRTLQFPFRDDKAISEAVGFELENHIPTPLSDLVIDQVRLGEVEGQTEVLAIAAPRKVVERWIDMLREAGTDPRRLGVNGLAYASLIRQLPGLAVGTTMLVDVGVRNADVVVTRDGATQFLRSLSIGSDGIAAGLASHLPGTAATDESFIQNAWLLPQGALPETQQERQLHDATVAALAPLLRELRQTLSSWMRKSHAKPDRIVLTGGLGRLAGLHEFLEQSLGLPVEPVRLQQLPDQRLSDADQLGDIGALAVAQAFSSAEARADLDVDLRQGDLAYEGDFKVLRARMPQMAAFLVVAVCLLGVRTSLNWRTLLTEQEQQLTQLVTLSKAVTNKTSRDFDDFRKELKREPSVDIAGLYPDISAFKVLEEISTIVDKVTEPPDYAAPPPGGPAEMLMPGGRADPSATPDPAMMRQAQFRGLSGMDGAPPPERPNSRAGRVRSREQEDEPGTPPADATGADGQVQPPADGAPAADKAKDVQAGHKLELASVQIERNSATVRGDADSQEALLALQQTLDLHRCFGKVKSSSDRITFERHHDWFKFTIQFEISCPAPEKAPSADQEPGNPAKGKASAGSDEGDEAPTKAKSDEESDEE